MRFRAPGRAWGQRLIVLREGMPDSLAIWFNVAPAAMRSHTRFPTAGLKIAADLVRKPVAVLVSTGGESAALAAKAATSTIPIAFIIGGDPVKLGLGATYSQPGGDATGISIMTSTLEPKRLEL